ncbi:hypothetical protein [Desulfotruncus alcoholivorax]|uniref:hypothetical protein n=1 Tax=Desulfotruncus alcoholivorax TaxID=265477 RepID=UPI000480E1B6|nr:hypothetical protein [Desulfotruncus alcoholivorax]
MAIQTLLLIANNALLLLAICFYVYERTAGMYWPALPGLARTAILFTITNILFVLNTKMS